MKLIVDLGNLELLICALEAYTGPTPPAVTTGTVVDCTTVVVGFALDLQHIIFIQI